MNEVDALLILNAIPGLGSIRIRRLLAFFRKAKNIFSSSEKTFACLGVPENVRKNLRVFDKDAFLQSEYQKLKEEKVKVITIQDEEYPRLLKEIPDPPIVLYVKGKLSPNGCIAVVGSRRSSLYGMKMAERLSRELSQRGVGIVSGLARGIDTSAHRGALAGGGRTYAVLGSGLSAIYPPENITLAQKISQDGAIISEFPMATPPLASHFPRRNRIISGLSMGVVVVEASRRSGALITARYALEQGREVFALPGQVDHPTAQGTNQLIRDGAKLLTHIDDIFDEITTAFGTYMGDDANLSKGYSSPRDDISYIEYKVLSGLQEEPIHIDTLQRNVSAEQGELMVALLRLELGKKIKQLPGKWFCRIA